MAGFIGSNLVKRIYQEAPSATVIGIDNMNAYYDVALKEFHLNELAKYPTFTFVKGNIADKELITELFEKYKPSVVVNLAAQAGVRYCITNPDARALHEFYWLFSDSPEELDGVFLSMQALCGNKAVSDGKLRENQKLFKTMEDFLSSIK
uniref:UDP glucuronic acid epimerase n=1 Tax=Lactococcus lactis TaxID=1358 RepID=A0A3Q9TD49_9LACT|nr:UDP glucuronic acid epimerase [Lactococcus lactis]